MPDDPMDLDLTKQDIGQLENRQAVTALFARLDYDVESATKAPLSALGFDAEDVAHQVLAAHRIGMDPEDGDIVVYLFEVRTVTKALIDALSRPFRERNEFPCL